MVIVYLTCELSFHLSAISVKQLISSLNKIHKQQLEDVGFDHTAIPKRKKKHQLLLLNTDQSNAYICCPLVHQKIYTC